VFRAATSADWPAIVALNNAEVPKVGPLTLDDAERFFRAAEILVADGEPGHERPGPVALLVLMTEGAEYDSPNFAWFAARYPRFEYVDRIVVRDDRAGTGIGRALYDLAVTRTVEGDRPVLTAEVNLEPPNDGSLAFHRRYGFAEVGQQIDPRNGQVEAMFALDISGRRAEPGRYTSTSDFPVQRPEPMP
jgi:predicted GNAT superfamily acetyltransferase